MAKFQFDVSIEVDCPSCGQEERDDFEAVYGTEYYISNSGVEVQAIAGDMPDDLTSYDSLIAVRCLKCKHVFRIDVESSEGDVYTMREIEFISAKVKFSNNGAPAKLLIGKTFFTVESVLNYQPLHSSNNDALIGRPPFGDWTVRLRHSGRCKVWVNPSHGQDLRSLDGDRILVSITAADGFVAPALVEADKHAPDLHAETQEDVERVLEGGFGQMLPHRFLTEAAFSVIVKTEGSLRDVLWKHLEDKYLDSGPNWWRGNLFGQLAQEIRRRAQTSGDANFLRFSPQEFLTLGEIRDLIDKKWDAVFHSHFESKARLDAAMIRFEDSRNPVAHGRKIDYQHYLRALDSAKEVLQLVAPQKM